MLLRDPGVDVLAVTVAGTGEVRCPAGLRNARRLVAAFGRSDIPVACGRDNPGVHGGFFPAPDAHLLDTTRLDIEAALRAAVAIVDGVVAKKAGPSGS